MTRSTTPRTPQKRAEVTRAALLAATIDCLVRDGYRDMSTNDVVRQAGSSRGALAHHFPTKADLVRAAVTRLVDLRVDEFRARLHGVPAGARTLAGATEILWSFLDDEAFAVVIELLVAAHRDPDLRLVLAAVPEQVTAVAVEAFGELFPDVGPRPHTELVLRGIVAMFVGLSVQAGVDGDATGRHAAVRALLRDALSLIPRDRPTEGSA